MPAIKELDFSDITQKDVSGLNFSDLAQTKLESKSIPDNFWDKLFSGEADLNDIPDNVFQKFYAEIDDEEKDNLKSSLFYSKEMGIETSEAYDLLPALNDMHFGERTTNAWQRIKSRYNNGKIQVKLDDLSYQILNESWKNPQAFEQNLEKIRTLQSQQTGNVKEDARYLWEKAIGASAETMPFAIESARAAPLPAIAGGLLFGIGDLVLGQLGPQIATPEESVTLVPAIIAGTKWGAGIGGADRIRQLEAGGMFLELMDMTDDYGNRIDPKLAFVASHAVGSINGAIELWQWSTMLKAFGISDQIFKKAVEKTTAKLFAENTLKQAIAKSTIRYGTTVGANVLQEVEQESSNIAFGILAKEINNARAGSSFKVIDAEDIKRRYEAVISESLMSFGVISLPGIPISTAIETLSIREKAKITKKAPVITPTEGVRPAEAKPEALPKPLEGELTAKLAEVSAITPAMSEAPITSAKDFLIQQGWAKDTIDTWTPEQIDGIAKQSGYESAVVETAPKRPAGLFGQPIFNPITGEQLEFLDKKDYELTEPDIEGQKKMEFGEEELPGMVSQIMQPELTTEDYKNLTKSLVDEIQKNPSYQNELDAIEKKTREIDVGFYYVPKNLKGEVEQVIGKPFQKGFNPALYKMFTFDPTKGATDWSKAVQKGLLQQNETGEWITREIDIGEFVQRVKESLESKKQGYINKEALNKSIKSGDLETELLYEKFNWLSQGLPVNEINENIERWAASYGINKDDIAGEFIEKPKTLFEGAEKTQAQLSELEKYELERKEKWYRAHIHILAAQKGMGKQALSDLKLKHGGARQLIGKRKPIGLQGLEKIYAAIKKVRPKQVGYEKVISLKTERQIKTLKTNLMRKQQMTEDAWKDILQKETNGKEPRYINAQNYITQKQARNVIHRMHNVSTLLRVTEPYEQAARDNPEISKSVDIIDKKLETEHRVPWSLESMRWYAQQARLKTGAPIDLVYDALIDIRQENTASQMAIMKSLAAEVGEEAFAQIASDDAAKKRISDAIDSKSYLENRPEFPKDITANEIKIANKIEKIFEGYRLKCRVAKFFNYYYYDQPIAEYEKYKKEINKAFDIYDTKGEEELVEYLKTQEWGIKHSGYDPAEMLLRKIFPYETKPITVGKSHIKISNAIEYHEQERDILQRLGSYMRQMDMLSNMSPLIKTFIQLYDDNAGKFDNWNVVQNNIELFIRELKGYNIPKNELIKWWRRIVSQAAQTLLPNSLTITSYNLVEEFMLSPDKSLPFVAFAEGSRLSVEDVAFLETYIHQQKYMLEQFFLTGEKTLPILEPINKLARRIGLVSRSDIVSRYLGYYGKLHQVRIALKAKTIKEIMSQAKFSDMTLLEQRKALTILAKDGKDTMARYVARVYVNNTHFLYDRAQRSPAEMGEGVLVTNLMLFARAYTERLTRAAYNAINPASDLETRYRNSKIFLVTVIGGTIGGAIISKVTGSRRNPYNPLNILSWQFGGLSFASLELLGDMYTSTLDATAGDKKAIDKLIITIPKLPETFVPFYAQILRAFEKMANKKYIDRYALREIKKVLDEDYKQRPNAYKFNKTGIINAVRYILLGRSIDVKEEKSKQKTKAVPITKK